MSSPAQAVWRLARRVWARRPMWPSPHDRFHSVRDYRRMVRRLVADLPGDEGVRAAVGGEFDTVGPTLAEVMLRSGLRGGMGLLDLGCGSGRLAQALSRRVEIAYLGLDVVPELLTYARRTCPAAYRFVLNSGYRLPAADGAFDRVAAFSLFTHLRHEESYLYLAEAARVLKPGGAVVFSFLEFADPEHWAAFERAAHRAATGGRGPVDVFVERPVINQWAARLDLQPPLFVSGGAAGQALAILRKPEATAAP